ncbi:PaaI family thioesterase [Nocardia sp. CA-129566]|uniref:PaaI family thioesterase n=1 Tax=Nocardia sp. CA-129566 TaxID=3239976 RepID=UPI003D98C18D
MTAADFTAMTGLELMRWAQRERPADIPSIGRLIGITIEEVEEGHATMSVQTKPDFSNPLGQVHGGIAATLLDSVMACAVHTTLPAGARYTTLELKVNYIRSVALDAGRITAEGRVIHVGRTVATAESKALDDSGKLVAHATTTCMIFRSQ